MPQKIANKHTHTHTLSPESRIKMSHPYSTLSTLRNREIETETLIFAPISLSYIEID